MVAEIVHIVKSVFRTEGLTRVFEIERVGTVPHHIHRVHLTEADVEGLRRPELLEAFKCFFHLSTPYYINKHFRCIILHFSVIAKSFCWQF